jgi:TonB family protein
MRQKALCRIGWLVILAITRVALAGAYAQSTDTLRLRMTLPSIVADSETDAMPASHRSAIPEVDRPVEVKYCPEPTYPSALAEYGFSGRVVLRFVVDTLGRPELKDLVVAEVSNEGFVESARRAVAKCRYRPAELSGRPVRQVVEQGVAFRQLDPDSAR